MQYKLVSAERGDALDISVNNLIVEGWTPLGGVSVCVLHTEYEVERKGYIERETEWRYTQAMVKNNA